MKAFRNEQINKLVPFQIQPNGLILATGFLLQFKCNEVKFEIRSSNIYKIIYKICYH